MAVVKLMISTMLLFLWATKRGKDGKLKIHGDQDGEKMGMFG